MLVIFVFSLLYLNAFGTTLKEEKPFYDIKLAESYFADFIRTYNRIYDNEAEYKMRFGIFVEQLKKINALNEEHAKTTFGVHPFADMTPEEIAARQGFRPNPSNTSKKPSTGLFNECRGIPDTVDWRKNNSVTPVRNQANCGSCWAFSAVAVIESQVAIKHKKLLDLSEQQIVDCDYGSGACNGGDEYDAMQYLAGTGIMLEADYPYQASEANCAYDPAKVAVKGIKGTLYNFTETEMAQFVANYGPLSIALCMTDSLIAYKSGVVTPKDCTPRCWLDHALAVVGYGTEDGTPYWLIKNSWGLDYGDQGYLKMVRGKKACKITDELVGVEIQ